MLISHLFIPLISFYTYFRIVDTWTLNKGISLKKINHLQPFKLQKIIKICRNSTL